MSIQGKTTVLVQRFDVRKSRKGDSFASLVVNLGRAGNYGSLDAKIWQFDRYLQSGRPLPREGGVIEAVYRPGEYQGQTQWTIEDFDILEGERLTTALEEFIQPPRIDQEFYRPWLESLIAQADPDRAATQVLCEIFDRQGFREAFFESPAAISHHQNYRGGLLEHTLNVTTLALALADAYRPGALSVNGERPVIDRSLLLSAGLLHDIGKIDTYRLAPIAQPTDANVFQGHLSISYAVVYPHVARMKAAPPYDGACDELDKLLNCILSHHGALEFGSPVLPACIEAFLLSQADMTDARMASFVQEGQSILRQNPSARWLRHPHFPSGIFIGDWPRPAEKPTPQ